MPPATIRLRELIVRYTVAKDPQGLPVSIDRALIADPRAAAAAFLPLFQDEPAEVFGILCLSVKHRVIAYREVGRGTVNGVTIQPREIFQVALLANAAALIVGHNHPSGVMRTPGICGVAELSLDGALDRAWRIAGPRIIGVRIILGR